MLATLTELVARVDEPIATIGITDQRETVVVWDKATSQPLHRAIVWQDRRTADRCDELAAQVISTRSGAPPASCSIPYFSASKLGWLIDDGHITVDRYDGVRHGRQLADVEPHRRHRTRHRYDERQSYIALRHRDARLVGRHV